MKRFFSVLLALCMLLGVCPAISFAAGAETTVNAVRTVNFNTASEWTALEGSTESGGSSVLIAWKSGENWNAANSFTDTDGTVVNQTVTSGVDFGSSRNALVAFKIPTDFDAEKVAKVTLGLKVRYVKQIDQAGARLAVYGNSINGTWSMSNNKTTFGANGADSGLANLPLLGLTTPISKAGGNQVDETITLSSLTLTDYVKKMAAEGKTEVTFRLAVPYGGVWIYNASSAYPPTLTFEDGELTTVKVKTVYMDGEKEVDSSETTLSNVIAGSTYTYTETPVSNTTVDGVLYTYSKADSTLSATAAADGSSEIVIVYKKFDDSQMFSGYELTDEGAWCWFADPRSISYKNEEGTIDITIMGYIDVHGNIKATQVNNLTNKVDEVLIRSNIQPDDHNNPTFIVLPDERIVVFYSRHTDENCFWYRVTKEPGDLTTLGDEKCLNTNHSTTYPSPFIMENDPDHIYLMWRGVNWHPTCARLTMPDEDGNMKFDVQPFQVVSSTAQGSGCRPYAKYASDGKGKIYMTYTSTHPDNIYPVCIYYSCLDVSNFTLYDINGGVLKANVNTSGPFTVNGKETDSRFVVDPTSTSQRGWVWQIAISEDGKPVIAMVRINQAKSNHDYYYAKWNGSSWVKTFLDNGGTSFHQSTSAGLELCYSGGMTIDPDNTNVMYCSVPVEGVFGKVYEIVKYTMSDDGATVLDREQITYNSKKNNVRPFLIPNTEGDDLRLIWMHGDYYDWIVSNAYTTQGYCTGVMTNALLPAEDVDLSDAAVAEDYEEIGGAFVATSETANVIEAFADDEFTVSVDLYTMAVPNSTVLDMGSFGFKIENRNTQYGATATGARARAIVTVGDEEFLSSNVYGTSDCWVGFNRGTGGNYGVSDYSDYVNLTFTYDGNTLKVYRNGLFDMAVEAAGLSVENIVAGNFDGYVENAVVYDRVLNHDEISDLADAEFAVADPGVAGDVTVSVNVVTNTGEQILPTEEVVLSPGTDTYKYNPEATIWANGYYYELNEELSDTEYDPETGSVTAVYEKVYKAVGQNLIADGSFEDANGNFSWGTWQSPSTGNYFKDVCNDWFYKVNRTTNAAQLYPNGSGYDDYALGTRWNDGVAGLCSMANFIPVEKGKTYLVSYDYKNRTAGASSATIRTTFQKTKSFTPDDAANNNIPVNVTTDWQTNTFLITAPEDGYIYFHFYWLGSGGDTNTGSNQGNGPYWYFDEFEVFELEKETVKAEITNVTDSETTVVIENVSASNLTDIKVYVASYDAEGIVTKAEVKTVSIDTAKSESLTFNVGGDVKVYIWDNGMNPICGVITE